MLTIIESESNAWTVIATDGELRIYSRKEPGEWSQLSLSEDPDQADQDKSEILEELYLRDTDQEEDDEDQDEPQAGEEDEDSEPEEDEESQDDEDEEAEEKQPRRRRSAARGK